jgi:hypothetical protein
VVKKKVKKKNKEQTKTTPTSTKVEPEREVRFDFGGLPIRDLKKNLGCG